MRGEIRTDDRFHPQEALYQTGLAELAARRTLGSYLHPHTPECRRCMSTGASTLGWQYGPPRTHNLVARYPEVNHRVFTYHPQLEDAAFVADQH